MPELGLVRQSLGAVTTAGLSIWRSELGISRRTLRAALGMCCASGDCPELSSRTGSVFTEDSRGFSIPNKSGTVCVWRGDRIVH